MHPSSCACANETSHARPPLADRRLGIHAICMRFSSECYLKSDVISFKIRESLTWKLDKLGEMETRASYAGKGGRRNKSEMQSSLVHSSESVRLILSSSDKEEGEHSQC